MRQQTRLSKEPADPRGRPPSDRMDAASPRRGSEIHMAPESGRQQKAGSRTPSCAPGKAVVR